MPTNPALTTPQGRVPDLGRRVNVSLLVLFGVLVLLTWGALWYRYREALGAGALPAGWREDVVIAAGATTVLAIAFMIAGWLIGREVRARAAATTRLTETYAGWRASRERFQAILDYAPLLVAVKSLDGRYTFINRTATERLGLDASAVLGKTPYDMFPKEHAELQTAFDHDVVATRTPVQREIVIPYPSGARTMLVIKFPLIDAQGAVEAIGSIAADVSDLKQAEAQLVHAQKMDAIGQLTGGIAHDFNNLLTAILLNSDVLAERVQDDRLRPLAEATRLAAERGADLTRRLLAFGRRQTLEPRPTDVNELVRSMEQLMRRTIGEHIVMELKTAPDLHVARIDPGQLESAVLNLALNARDAMPQGGRLTIETANVELDADYATLNPDVKPGEYVMVAVGDSGSGMPPDVVARAFEPFFTTKEVGKGTGLGLSMVYGFVKQSGGHVRIYSEPGFGTIVRLYLPRSDGVAAPAPSLAPEPAELPRGTETILLVEDDALVRAHTGGQLAALGYVVVAAENAAEAMERAEVVPDLLFTDIVMPGEMNGFQLAEALCKRWPQLRVLYTSGFAHGAAPLDRAVPARYMLGKPFRRRDLALKVREVLDEDAPSPLTSAS
jgi:PAS domain S-box-containing protein